MIDIPLPNILGDTVSTTNHDTELFDHLLPTMTDILNSFSFMLIITHVLIFFIIFIIKYTVYINKKEEQVVVKQEAYKRIAFKELNEEKLEVFHESVNSSNHSTFDDVRFKMQFDSDIREAKKELTVIKRSAYKTLVLKEIREEQLEVISKSYED